MSRVKALSFAVVISLLFADCSSAGRLLPDWIISDNRRVQIRACQRGEIHFNRDR